MTKANSTCTKTLRTHDWLVDNHMPNAYDSLVRNHAMSKRKLQVGGYRPGSGRKPKFDKKMTPTSIMLPDDVVAILDDLAEAKSGSRSEVILDLLAKSHRPIRDAIDTLKRKD